MKNAIIGLLIAVIAAGGAIGAFAASRTVEQTFEIRVWEKADDPSANYISARPAGGDWKTLGTISIKLDTVTDNGKWRYADISLDVAVEVDVCDPTTEPCEPVEGQVTATPTPTPTPISHTHSHSYSYCQRYRVDGGCDQRYSPPRIRGTYTHTHSVDCTHYSWQQYSHGCED